jgi:hypothetical protein
MAEPEIWGGNLIKLSHGGLKGWKKRYFVLEAGRLFYYDKLSKIPDGIKPTSKPLATSSLFQVIFQLIENADVSEASRHRLYLTNPDGGMDLTLGCSKIDEALEWKIHFEKHIEFANRSPEAIAPSEEVARRIFHSVCSFPPSILFFMFPPSPSLFRKILRTPHQTQSVFHPMEVLLLRERTSPSLPPSTDFVSFALCQQSEEIVSLPEEGWSLLSVPPSPPSSRLLLTRPPLEETKSWSRSGLGRQHRMEREATIWSLIDV